MTNGNENFDHDNEIIMTMNENKKEIDKSMNNNNNNRRKVNLLGWTRCHANINIHNSLRAT